MPVPKETIGASLARSAYRKSQAAIAESALRDPDEELLAQRKAQVSELLKALKDQLDGHWATWMAARAEVEGAETSKQLFEREPDVIRARALIAKFEA